MKVATRPSVWLKKVKKSHKKRSEAKHLWQKSRRLTLMTKLFKMLAKQVSVEKLLKIDQIKLN